MDSNGGGAIRTELSKAHVGVVCPMANERDTAVDFVNDVLEQCCIFHRTSFFVVLDNASKDGTLDLMRGMAEKDERVRVVWAPENRCVVDAYMRGYREALASGCHWMLEIDAGYSHDPADAAAFFELAGTGRYDCVFGTRFAAGGGYRGGRARRKAVSRIGSALSRLLLGRTPSDMTSGYQFFSREAVERFLDFGIRSRGHFFQTEMKAACLALDWDEVPIRYTNPSSSVGFAVIVDALANLARLAWLRAMGRLET